MRPLTEDETRLLFQKLIKYVSPDNIKLLLERPDAPYCFRLHKGDRVYYVRRSILKLAANVGRDHLVSLGTCFGKFTKTGKQFRLSITGLNTLAPYGKYKIWLKAGAEQQFLYGHNVVKSGLARISEDVPKYAGVFIFGSSSSSRAGYKGGGNNASSGGNSVDGSQLLPLGFGVAAKSTQECRAAADPLTIVCFHQADIGEYLRHQGELA